MENMKTKIKVEKEVNIKTIVVNAGVRYWEDSEVNGVEDEHGDLIPCRIDDRWKPIINIETGIITNWKKGVVANIHYRVCDDGSYFLKDDKGKTVFKKDGYVPSFMCPKENGFGDYIIMDVDADGKISDWDIDEVMGFINNKEED